MTETTNISPQIAQPAAPEKPKERTGIAALFPEWIVNNATRITNAGLMTFTSIMLYSGYRGKVISKDIYDAQLKEIKTGVASEAAGRGWDAAKIAAREKEVLEAGLKSKAIKAPGWHKMRLFYLLTATASFAFGAFFKRKEETPEELEKLNKTPLPQYMATRFGQAFDPINHSRQTVGVVSGTSGVLAVISALSQPGGVHRSELFVGSSLAAGGALLAFINDPKAAQNAFSTIWLMRTPAIITGTNESMNLKPKYVDGYLSEMKNTPAFIAGKKEAAENGFKETVKGLFGFAPTLGIKGDKGFFGLGKDKIVPRTGEKAAKAFEKAFAGSHTHELPYKRNDIAYPIGQWGNLASAGIGYLGKGADTKSPDKKDTLGPVEVLAHDVPAPQHVAAVPQNKVGAPAQTERLQDAPELADALPIASHG